MTASRSIRMTSLATPSFRASIPAFFSPSAAAAAAIAAGLRAAFRNGNGNSYGHPCAADASRPGGETNRRDAGVDLAALFGAPVASTWRRRRLSRGGPTLPRGLRDRHVGTVTAGPTCQRLKAVGGASVPVRQEDCDRKGARNPASRLCGLAAAGVGAWLASLM